MKPFIGSYVWIPCEVKTGAFSDERMVLLDSDCDEWLGFAPISSLKEVVSEGESHIKALVVNVNCEVLTVKVLGEPLTSGYIFNDLISRTQPI